MAVSLWREPIEADKAGHRMLAWCNGATPPNWGMDVVWWEHGSWVMVDPACGGVIEAQVQWIQPLPARPITRRK